MESDWKNCHCGGEVIDHPKDKGAVKCTRCSWKGFKILWVRKDQIVKGGGSE